MSSTSTFVPISKMDADRQLIYGEVYVPMVPDTQGDFMTAPEIEKMAHKFISKGLVSNVDTEHNLEGNGSLVVESFIAREGDPDFIVGSWVVGVHVVDTAVWKSVKDGEINGFSMFGSGTREEKLLEIEIPDDGILKGDTAVAGMEDHTHEFAVKFDNDGKFLGGVTGPGGPDGHIHKVERGTITEEGGPDGHSHRYSFLESMVG